MKLRRAGERKLVRCQGDVAAIAHFGAHVFVQRRGARDDVRPIRRKHLRVDMARRAEHAETGNTHFLDSGAGLPGPS